MKDLFVFSCSDKIKTLEMALKKVIYWNCAGGIKSKHDYIKQIISEENPCAFFISEAEIKDHDLDIVKIRNYDLVVANTIKNGSSRVACFIKSDINYRVIKVKDESVDIIAIETNFDRLIGLYRGFKLPVGASRVSFFDSIITQLKALSKTCKRLTIGGDFNVDLFKPSSNLNDLDNWSMEMGLDQLVRELTRKRLVHL
jgi:exonuclease III